ncbi:DUF2189 domain-containing protein [Sinorhizobium sp. BG8]|uniref:DUF2189 domain-containing protein n=1 Tax=Sinorhizobium sp. BG8 TaxID=2613773 RepID=UPI00193EAAAD|nr:DUF2189 domain-containing protein [Sinorhizobium sp. BG8]QRM55630.1 DUF2189 domain-containing protein [Sinorhizobium sp. BG8]
MTAFHVMAGPNAEVAHPVVRKISVADVWDALAKGLDDFREKPSHYVFLCLIYPISGVVLMTWSSGANLLPLMFPLMAGFALLGPFFALGLYEISRRREIGMDTSWQHALRVRHSPALPAILTIGFMLVVLFIAWLLVAQGVYTHFFGEEAPRSLGTFLNQVLHTEAGWMMMIAGNAIGFCFAVVVLATTVVAFPLLLDRDVGVVSALDTSLRATFTNPVPIAVWGLIVTAGLVIGTIPIFAGLAVIMPILGHATWHLYRKLVVVPLKR